MRETQPGICYATRPRKIAFRTGLALNTLYGIKNCDTVKKARKWLEAENIQYQFHDVREDGLGSAAVKAWVGELGWESVVNKRSTTWKSLTEQERAAMNDAAAVKAIVEQPTLFKRPLLDTGKARYVGFSAANYSDIFKS